jgi:hypothetical protein
MPQNSAKTPSKPAFLITVDTEGDNLWSSPCEITTENVKYLPRFQLLCEKYGFKSTWLVNYEMAKCQEFVDFAKDVLQRDTGEIGMHLHGWNSPPLAPLTNDDMRNQPYLFEYPEAVMRDKICFMTDLLEDQFQRKMISHRAGRWGFNNTYARLLVNHGYQVDCSVTPHISWAEYLGDPNGSGGMDFRKFPETSYFVDLNNIDCPGDSPLLEMPLSVIGTPFAYVDAWMQSAPKILRRITRRFFPPYLEMVPRDNERRFRYMRTIMCDVVEQNRPFVMLATHSSELMPNGSPFFPTAKSIENLYERLEKIFATAIESFQGMTVAEYRNELGFKGERPA